MAAGKGTRMKSEHPKVLLPILEKPMLGYLLKTVLACHSDGIAVLVGHQGERVCEYLKAFPSVEPLWQREQLGTGHAVRIARPWWERFDQVLVLNGDLPLLEPETLRVFLRQHGEHLGEEFACSLLSFATDRPEGYGRVVREPGGGISIVEHKDATPDQRLIKEVNGGCYCFVTRHLSQAIDRLENRNAQGEYYLPDVLGPMRKAGLMVRASVVDEEEMLGVNTQAELARATIRVRDSVARRWMDRGVRVTDPSAVWIGPDVELAADVHLMPGVQIWGNSVVGEGSALGPYCVLRNARLGRRVNLIAYVMVENSELRDDSKAGPFAYIREGSFLDEGAFAGKFVELKKTRVGKNSKVPHLSYLGDAALGENVNIGAGSITCNYDGRNKFPTKIGDRCFVGSDTMMVAPVALGKDSMTAAGSTITADVPDGALAVGRARQKNIEGWALKKRELERELEKGL
ncbi:MAG: bifunctional UDP-N-acetylglucosamine diphosphorylase/glucosamine-1-phosphate N-acetyltransferase GlmU [Synergistaceae bacterium]|jgi:bifunctional UDP-N-acetylglucosamine pyrophosphorylase/glucosamine-1-phosphate N-acetyltransferase|nr:bifunctional UDP-N-acetylglucosamine diphosphorylase/glucosamine-1-phosphate N-acetyltransferase GlmU [Synergistaceae bacterium]